MKKAILILACSILLSFESCGGSKPVNIVSFDEQKLEMTFDELIKAGNTVFVGEFVEAVQVTDTAFENVFSVKKDIAGNLKESTARIHAYFGQFQGDMEHFKKGSEYLLIANVYNNPLRDYPIYVINTEMSAAEETGVFTCDKKGMPEYEDNEELFRYIYNVFWSVDRTEKERSLYTLLLQIEDLFVKGDQDYNANTYTAVVKAVYDGDEDKLNSLLKEVGYLYVVIEKDRVDLGKEYVLTVFQADENSLVFIQNEKGKVFESDRND